MDLIYLLLLICLYGTTHWLVRAVGRLGDKQ